VYPVSGAVWAILHAKQAARRAAVIAFLRWVTHEGQEHAGDLHYAPLPKKLVGAIGKKLEEATTGK
jgi:ABC-type phosphate transport system substrate-binding protein